MASKRQPVDPKLAEVFQAAPPANPSPTSADKNYLRGLKKRGYTEEEIIRIAAKAGYVITPALFVIKPKKPKTPAPEAVITA
jgi:hypothetical protein